MEEIWDLVNEQGEKVGVKFVRGSKKKIPKGLYHPGVEIWTRVGDGKLLVTKRHPKKSFPLKWEVSGGSLISGEEIAEGAARELFEETGISAKPEELTPLGKSIHGNFMAYSFLFKIEKLPPLTLQASEVVDAKTVTEEEFKALDMTSGTRKRFKLYRDMIFGEP